MAQPDRRKGNRRSNRSSHQFLSADKLPATQPSAQTDSGLSCMIGRCAPRSPDDNPIQSDLFILNEKHLKACPVLTYVFLCLSHAVPMYLLFAGQSPQTQKSHVISSTARALILSCSGHRQHSGNCLRAPCLHT